MRSCAVLVGALAGLAAGALMDNPSPGRFVRRGYAAGIATSPSDDDKTLRGSEMLRHIFPAQRW